MTWSHQSDRIARKPVLIGVGVVLVASIAFIGLAVVLTWHQADVLQAPPTSPTPERAPASVGAMDFTLFEGPTAQELQTRRDRRHLSSYGWVDRRAGIVHLPIERAIEVLVESAEVSR